MTKSKVLAFLVLVIGASSAVGSDTLIPLTSILKQLEGESNPEQAMYVVASRCMALSSWRQIRLLQSYEITGKATEKQESEEMGNFANYWSYRLMASAMKLKPNSTEDDIWEDITFLAETQVNAYNDSAWEQKALTGHFIPKSGLEDWQVCATIHDGIQ